MKELDDALLEVTRILQPVETGRSDRPRKVRRIFLTIDRMRLWHLEPTVSMANTHRGGTTSILDAGEAAEDYTLSRRTEYDARALHRHLQAVTAICLRYTVPIDTDDLPKGPPGCRSCARLPDHFNPIADRYQSKGLCNWCGERLGADGKLPPLDAVRVYHRQGASAAGRWMAKHVSHPTARRRKR